jgi:hypothetical protein
MEFLFSIPQSVSNHNAVAKITPELAPESSKVLQERKILYDPVSKHLIAVPRQRCEIESSGPLFTICHTNAKQGNARRTQITQLNIDLEQQKQANRTFRIEAITKEIALHMKLELKDEVIRIYSEAADGRLGEAAQDRLAAIENVKKVLDKIGGDWRGNEENHVGALTSK